MTVISDNAIARLRAPADSQIGMAAACYAPLLLADLVARIDPAALLADLVARIDPSAPLPDPCQDRTGLHLVALALHYARDPDPPVAWRAAVGQSLRDLMLEDPTTVSPLRLVAHDVAADQVEIGPPLRAEWDAWVATRLAEIA